MCTLSPILGVYHPPPALTATLSQNQHEPIIDPLEDTSYRKCYIACVPAPMAFIPTPKKVRQHQLDGHLSDIPYNARVCHNFRQIYDNSVVMRFMNNVSLLFYRNHHVKYT